MPNINLKQVSRWLGLVLVLLAASAPWYANPYYQSFLLQLFMMVALAQAWNLFSGMTGYISFGHTAFFGVGAYAGALFLFQGYPWWLAVLKGGGIALLLSVPLGFLTLRLRGPYFAIAMLGLNEVGRIVATLWESVTRGGDGISLNPALLPSLSAKYYTMLTLAIGATLLVAHVFRSRFGLELRAIREDEEAAEMVGVNTTVDKIVAFVLSAIIPGAVGAVYAMYISYINPSSVFSPALNIQMIVIVIFGGSGTVWGPILGAVIVMMSREVLWAQFPAAHTALLGILLLVAVLFMPDGLLSIGRSRHRVRPDARTEEMP
ncbi:MAG: branched-chain amino acid ABC transporter permease [Sulfuricaulis sp.]